MSLDSHRWSQSMNKITKLIGDVKCDMYIVLPYTVVYFKAIQYNSECHAEFEIQLKTKKSLICIINVIIHSDVLTKCWHIIIKKNY